MFALTGLTVALVIILVAVGTLRLQPHPGVTVPPSPPTTSTPPSPTPPSPPPSDPGTTTPEEDAAWQKLRDSPANSVTFAEHVTCAPAKTDAVSLGDAAFQKWVTGFVRECLVGLWAPALAGAGITLPAPPVIVVKGDSVDSPCGVATADEADAFECEGGIYVFRASLQQGWGSLGPWAMVFALSHEFGHYVQYRAGMFDDDVILYNGKGAAVAAAISRRVELQATCMGTMILGALAWQIPRWDPARDSREFGGATDQIHGTHANQQYWGARGYGSRDSRQCNTWAATDHLD